MFVRGVVARVFVVRAQPKQWPAAQHVPIGKQHGMADRKAALGRVDEAVTFDELTLTAYDEEERHSRPTTDGTIGAGLRRIPT